MKNIFSLRYILLVLICLGTRCGVLAQESPFKSKGQYVFQSRFVYYEEKRNKLDVQVGIYSDNNKLAHHYLHQQEHGHDDYSKLYDVSEKKYLSIMPKELVFEGSFWYEDRHIAFENCTYTTHYYAKSEYHAGYYHNKGYFFDCLFNAEPNELVYHNAIQLGFGNLYIPSDVIPWGITNCALFLYCIPQKIEYKYCTRNLVETDEYMSYSHDRVLCATPGYLKEVYNWEYGIGDKVENVKWEKISDDKKSADGSMITIKGADFFESEASLNSAIEEGKKIFFRIETPTDENITEYFDRKPTYGIYSDSQFVGFKPKYICLNLIKSGPSIKKVDQIIHCDGTVDLKIELDKPVAIKDRSDFNMFIDHKSLDGDNKNYEWQSETVFLFKGLGPKNKKETYILSVHGEQSDDTEVTIGAPIPINVSATYRDVSCYGGKNGGIVVKANGGNDKYIATLCDKDRPIKSVEFLNTDSAVFNNLERGEYYIELNDLVGGCSPDEVYLSDGTGEKKMIKEHLNHFLVTITQPLESVKIDTLNIIKIMPKAYNSTDGSISVYVSGGTFTSKEGKDGYTVILKNSDGVSYSHKEPYKDNGKYMYTFENLPKGKYTMIAQDARYSPSDVNPGDEPCGCMATYSFELIAPDPIKVEIKEKESIRCNGTNGGSLRATAKGGARGDNMRPYIYHWYEVKNDGTLKEFEQERDSTLNNIPAGKYCLVVEDANHTKSDSVYWEIKQPAPIEISFKVINPTFKKKYGSVEAIVTGGTPPYTYGWTKEGVTVNKLDSLETGEYQFYVMDSKECHKDTTVHVSEPDEIKIDTLVFRHPSCYGTNDGEISLKISGKNSSYTAVWADNKNAGLTRKGLKPGEYTLKVSDSDGNEIELKYKMEQPEQMKLEVGSAFVLCKGQGRMITASSNVEDAEYLWKRNGREIQSAVGSELFVNQDGVYEVICKKKDSDFSVSASVNVSVSDVDLPIDITMSTDVEVDEKIHGVNISTAKMDKFEWILPDGAEKVSQSDNEIVFIMHTPGTYTVRAVGYKGGCTTEVLQTLNVKGDGEAPLPTADGDPLLKQFIVSPNPTDKEFNVHIELSEKANIKLTLKSPTGAEVETINVSDVTSYDHGYELNGDVTDCVFTLELSTGDNKQKSIQRIRKTIIKNEEK